ncbi:MAG TPA: serine/threonine-protein kinase, partial [Kofleriaceae bacterium]|nr:serine/threonine-protein kinase [Kofleriaceae bacterium]
MSDAGGQAPQRIGHYVIERPLGAGGMGEVFVAFDPRLERRVAIKLVAGHRSADAAARSRMLREARSASALKHPGIVTVHEIGEADGRTYIAMELVEGQTFAERIAERGALPIDEALGLIARVADAVDAAHQAGILHRDIKSANLMVDGRGEVRVLDFGLSKRIGAPGPASVPPGAPADA